VVGKGKPLALSIGKINSYLATEQPWVGFDPRRRTFGQVGSRAPMWAQIAQSQVMFPRLEGRIQTANISDWAMLALWRCWIGNKFDERDPGAQLVYSIETDWAEFKDWLWKRFGV
jgi:hypothetical protein